jgi:hypothetical protein
MSKGENKTEKFLILNGIPRFSDSYIDAEATLAALSRQKEF